MNNFTKDTSISKNSFWKRITNYGKEKVFPFFNNIYKKFIAFSKEKSYYYLAFILPVIILIITYITMGMSPFGEKSVLTLDMDGQYVYFFEQLRDIYTGQASLFYTFERSLGGEFLGFFTYYLASPLSYLVVLFPASAITEAIMTMFLLKSGLAGLTFAIYLSHTRKRNPAGFTIFSVMYALCAYATMYQFNTMWMDALIWLPLIVLGIEGLIKHGKFKLFIISLALAICSNYYIGYMLCIFVAIYFFAFYVSKSQDEINGLNETNHFVKSLVRIAVASLIALMISAAIVFSAYYSLSLGKSGYQDNIFNGDLRFDLLNLIAKMFLGGFDTVRLVGTPNIYAGLLPLILLPAFYISKKVSGREKVVFTVLCLVFVTSFSINAIDLAWHGFQAPIWFNYRYSFMFSFIILLMAYRGYESIDELNVSLIGKTVCVLTLILIIIQKTVVLTRYEYLNGSWQPVEVKPGLTMVWVSILFLALYLLIFFLRKHLAQATTVLLVIVVFSEILVNTIINWDGELKDGGVAYRDNYRNYVDNLSEVTAELNKLDTGFYRTEHTFNRKYNDNLVLDINGISEFTSTFNASTVDFLGRLGFHTSSPIVKYSSSNPITDSLLGIKYVIGSMNDDTNGKFDGKNSINNSYKSVITKNGYVVYENPYVLPIAYCVDKDMQQRLNELDFFEGSKSFPSITKNLFDSILGYDSGIFSVCNYTTNKGTLYGIEYDVFGGKSFNSADDTRPAYFYFTVQATTDGNIYMHLPSPHTTSAKLSINGDTYIENFFQNETKTVYDLGYFEKGEVVTVKLEFTWWRLYLWDTKDYFVQINEERFEEAIRTLRDGGLKIDEHSDTHITGTISSQKDNAVFTTIPFDKNWQVYVDGERVDTYEALNSLLCFDITEGEHTVEMKYVHTPFVLGAVIGLFGIALLVALCLLDKFFGIKILPIKKIPSDSQAENDSNYEQIAIFDENDTITEITEERNNEENNDLSS